MRVCGVILAGGRSRRMAGASKATCMLGGRPLLARVVDRLAPQVDRLLVNLNEPFVEPQLKNISVVGDMVADYPGPLAGLASAMSYLDENDARDEAVVVAPCDGPFIPLDLVAILAESLSKSTSPAVCIRYDGELQPTFSLWRRALREEIDRELYERKQGGLKGLLQRLEATWVDWPKGSLNPFFNINTPADLQYAQELVGRNR